MSSVSSSISPLVMSMKDLELASTTANNVLYVVMFKAEWCVPCKQISPKVEELAVNYPSVLFYKLNIDDDDRADIAEYFSPTKVPSFFLYKNGVVLDSIIGTNLNKLEDLINTHL
mgnify:CR=1 FL=1